MKRNIILYNPSAVFYDMPLALLAIGTPLAEKYNVVIIDARIEKDIDAILKEHINDTIVVGITSLTGAPLKDAISFSRKVKSMNNELKVVWGGWHTSLFPEQVLSELPEADISVQGQGETSFSEIVAAVESKNSLEEIAGIAYRNAEGKIVKTKPRAMEDINLYGRLNYDLIDVEKYFKAKGRRQFDFITSAGCFFRCTFCADPFVFNRKFTSLEAQRVFEDLQYYHEKYRFNDLNFQDETFFTYPKQILELANKLKSYGTKFSWAATMRADQGNRMSTQDFQLCKDAGLRRLLIGVESGSQEMMDWLKKDIKMEHVLLCAERCKELDINVIFPFIVGFPGETNQNIEDTKATIRKLSLMSDGFETPIFYFKPYPGTKITQDVINDGLYTPPTSMEEWANFDYIGSKGPWVSDALFTEIERFKFYLRANRQRSVYMLPLKWISRFRIRNLNFKMPIEKAIIDRIRPQQELS